MCKVKVFFVFVVILFLTFSIGKTDASAKENRAGQDSSGSSGFKLTAKEKAWIKAHPVIRIGIMNAWPPLDFVDHYGRPEGIGVDYINALNRRLGGILTIVPHPFKENMELVKQKKLDALMDITPKKEREPFFNFTTPYLTIPHVIVARKNGPYFHSEKELAGKTVALEKGFYNVRYFHEKFPDVRVKEYDSTSAALDAVARGEADAYAGNRAVAMYLIEKELMSNLQVQGRLNKDPVILSIGIRKDWPELAGLLDRAFASISIQQDREIHRKWLGEEVGNGAAPQINLTPDELSWIRKHQVIKVGNTADFKPYDFAFNNQPQGYGVDLLNLLAGKIGLTLRYINQPNRSDMITLFNNNQIDLMQSVYKSPEIEKSGLFSKSFLSLQPYFITRRDSPEITDIAKLKTIAVVIYSPVETFLSTQHPDIHLLTYNTAEQVLAAVEEGKAPAVILDNLIARYIIAKKRLYDLQFSGKLQEPNAPNHRDLYFVAHKDAPQLIGILNKALAILTPGEIQELETRWFGDQSLMEVPQVMPQEITFNQTTFVLKSITFVFFLLLLIIIISWLLNGRPKNITIRRTLFGVLFIFVGLTIAIGTFITLLLDMERKMTDIERQRYASIQLAYELKQSSDDLTRFVRAFAVTGKPKYERYYKDILAIRDGKRPHPKDMTPSYWDFVAAGDLKPNEDGPTYSIAQKMMDLGLTRKEIDKLTTAKKESDDLTYLETIAMNAVKGRFKDAAGNFSVKGEPDLAAANKLLNSQEYYAAKAKIMKPIDEFFTLIKLRTTNKLNLLQKKTKAVIFAVILLTFLTVLFAFFAFFLLKRRIISPLYLLASGAGILERGDYTHHIEISTADEVGELAGAFNSMTDSIKERTTKLRSIIDTAVDAIIVISAHGNVQEFSPAAERIFGFSAAEVLGQNVSMLMPEPLRSQHDDHLAHFLQTGEKHILDRRTETLGQRKNGDIFPIGISISQAMLGDEIFFTGIVRDITELKEAEQELKKLSSALEQSPVAVIITDRKGDIEYVNTTFTSVTGYTFEEVRGRNPRFLKSGNYSDKEYENIWKTIMAGETWFGDMINLTKDGKEIWERTAIAPLLDEQGQVSHFVSVKEDISEQKRMAKEIQDSETLHRLLADCSSDMIVQYGMDHKAVYISPACLELTGYEPTELIGKSIVDILHPDDQQKAMDAIDQLKATSEKISLQLRLHRKDGSYCWIDKVSQLIIDQETNEATGILAISRDITERRLLEDARRSSLLLNQMPDKTSTEEILRKGLNECVRLTESTIGYLHFVNQPDQTVELQVWSDEMNSNCSVSDNLQHYAVEDAGIWADCIRKKAPVLHNDYKTLAGRHELPEGHVNLVRHMAIPMVENDEVVAVVGVGNKYLPYTQYDINIVSLLVENIWSIIRRKRNEETIRSNEERMQLVLKGGNLGYWDSNFEKKETIVNDLWAEIMGFTLSEITNPFKLWRSSLHPDDREWVLKTGREYLAGTIPSYDIEYRLITRQGDVKWLIARGSIVERKADGKPLRIVGTMLDITSQKEIEQELRENMNDLQRFSNISIGREERMIELKQEVNELLNRSGTVPKYKIVQ